MISNIANLQKTLCTSLCRDIRVEKRPDGVVVLRSPFQFPDGDHYPIHVSEISREKLRLSDCGHTLMHISYEHDIDAFVKGARSSLLENIATENGLQRDDGAFYIDTASNKLPEAIFRFGQALTNVFSLTLLSRSRIKSTFYDDLRIFLYDRVDDEKIVSRHFPDQEDKNYYVDYKIQGKHGIPLFLYGVHSRDKARLTTIMLSHFHLREVSFESMLVFKDQTEISRSDLARLSNVGGDMISSLDAKDDFHRKLHQRVGN